MECLALRSRDNARPPVQWDGLSPNTGFTTGTPWIEVNPNYTAINAAAVEEKTRTQVLNYYKQMITPAQEPFGTDLRLLPASGRGDPRSLPTGVRLAETGENYLIACSFSDKDAAFFHLSDFAGPGRRIGNYLTPLHRRCDPAPL